MDKLFSTMDVHPRDRFDYWHDVACRTIAGHSSKPASKQNFEARSKAGRSQMWDLSFSKILP